MGKTGKKSGAKAKRKRLRSTETARKKRVQTDTKNPNVATIAALANGFDVMSLPVVHHNLDFAAGTWVEDPAFDEAIRDQQRIFPEDWNLRFD